MTISININTIILIMLIAGLGIYFLWLLPKRLSYSFKVLQKQINSEIRESVQTKFLKVSIDLNRLRDLAIDIWRMNNKIEKYKDTNKVQFDKGIQHSLLRITKYLQDNDIQVKDYTNAPYNDGLNVDVLSVEKCDNETLPIIKETVEPAILYKGQLIRRAKVIIARSE